MARKDAAYREATRSLLRQRLDHGPPLLLDGAIGSELERRAVPASLPLWSSHALLTHPEVLAAVHADYVAAGAEILTANSFRTQRRTLTRARPPAQLGERDAELTALAVALAARRLARPSGGSSSPARPHHSKTASARRSYRTRRVCMPSTRGMRRTWPRPAWT